MGKRSSTVRRLVRLVALALLLAGWFHWLRPVSLGGRESYVVVDGHSMEGTYQDGDLVVVQEEGEYGVGDIIAFRAGGEFDDPTRIIHRIVARAEGDAFFTQGDNRDRIDPWQPGPEDIIGRAHLHVPHAGDIARSAARPQALAALGGAAVILGRQKRRRRRRMILRPEPPTGDARNVMAPRPRVRGANVPRWQRRAEPMWAFAGLVVCAALLVPVLALTWAAMSASDRTVRVEHLGQVDYGVGVDYRLVGDPSPVYPTGVVEIEGNAAGGLVPSGPLYSKLLHRLELALTFEASETGADQLATTYAVDVSISTPGGWSSTLESIPVTPFDGRAAQPVVVDLREAAARVAQVGELTGVGGDEFTLTVAPRLAVDGTGGGQTIQEELAPPLEFVVRSGVITAEAVREIAQTRDLTRETEHRARYGLGPLALPMQAARGLLGGLVLVVLGAAGWFASVLFGGVGLGESARIAARYRSQVVDVAVATAPPGPVVMVGSIEELARLARVEQTVILHEDLGDGCHRYRVFLGAVTYEYESAPEHAGSAVGSSDLAPDRPEG